MIEFKEMSNLKLILILSFGNFFVTGLSIGYIASYLLLNTVAYLSPWLPVWLWIGDIGLFIHAIAIAATSAVGVIAVVGNKSHGLKMCTYILIGLFLVELTATIQICTRKLALDNAITSDLKHAMQSSQDYYSTHLNDTQMWDEIQLEKDCCGIKDYQDWFSTEFGNGVNVPDSCCLLITKDCGKNIGHSAMPEDDIITNGCLPTLINNMRKEYNYYGYYIWLPAILSQIVLLVIIIVAERKMQKKRPSYFLSNISGTVHEENVHTYKRLENDIHG